MDRWRMGAAQFNWASECYLSVWPRPSVGSGVSLSEWVGKWDPESLLPGHALLKGHLFGSSLETLVL